MRIHGDNITGAMLRTAEHHAGVELTYSNHGSRSRKGAVEVSLTGSSKRRPNHYYGGDVFAATWDQWGVFFAALFTLDSTLTIPRTYTDERDFHAKTANRFVNGWPADAHGDHTFRWQGVPNQQSCTKCSATMNW